MLQITRAMKIRIVIFLYLEKNSEDTTEQQPGMTLRTNNFLLQFQSCLSMISQLYRKHIGIIPVHAACNKLQDIHYCRIPLSLSRTSNEPVRESAPYISLPPPLASWCPGSLVKMSAPFLSSVSTSFYSIVSRFSVSSSQNAHYSSMLLEIHFKNVFKYLSTSIHSYGYFVVLQLYA